MKVRSRSASQGSQYEPRVLYGSEPDLRLTGRDFQGYNDSPSKLRISRSRKKYKAPPAPQNSNGVSKASCRKDYKLVICTVYSSSNK